MAKKKAVKRVRSNSKIAKQTQALKKKADRSLRRGPK